MTHRHELELSPTGGVRCTRCPKTWTKTEWAEIEQWGLEVDAPEEQKVDIAGALTFQMSMDLDYG